MTCANIRTGLSAWISVWRFELPLAPPSGLDFCTGCIENGRPLGTHVPVALYQDSEGPCSCPTSRLSRQLDPRPCPTLYGSLCNHVRPIFRTLSGGMRAGVHPLDCALAGDCRSVNSEYRFSIHYTHAPRENHRPAATTASRIGGCGRRGGGWCARGYGGFYPPSCGSFSRVPHRAVGAVPWLPMGRYLPTVR